MRSGIGRISLDTNDMFDVVLPIENVHGAVVVDYHLNHSKIFYADVNTDVIKVVDINDMKNTKDIITTGLQTTNGLGEFFCGFDFSFLKGIALWKEVFS